MSLDLITSKAHFSHTSIQGVGLGLRHAHFNDFSPEDEHTPRPDVPWLEVHTENFMYPGSAPAKHLEHIREHYPLSMHCIGMSLGTDYHDIEPFLAHLSKLKHTIDRYEPSLVSDHLSWSGVEHQHFVPDLLPIPYTQEALTVVVDNINRAQDVLKRQILVENPSSYLSYTGDIIPEWEFLVDVAKRSGCALLLDLNNIYVSSHNHGFDADHYLNAIPVDMVREIHLAGYSVSEVEGQDVYIDTHSKPVYDGVWQLYDQALHRFGDIPTLIEWDVDVPDLSVLMEEKSKADARRHAIFTKESA